MLNKIAELAKGVSQSVNRAALRKFAAHLAGIVLATVGLANRAEAAPSWTVTGSMTDARAVHTATLLASGQVLVAGGTFYDGTRYVLLASAELYDPLTENWTATGSLNTPRAAHQAVLLPCGQVLVVGGATDAGPPTDAELYDPVAGSWSVVSGPPDISWKLTATLLPNGKVLVAGGSDNRYIGYVATSGARLYDPVTGTWASTGSMNNARYSHTATLLPNGKVLVAGGVGRDVLPSAELYDPASGQWTMTGPMSFPRHTHTATLLPNGTVLVVTTDPDGPGGSEARSAGELYHPDTGVWTLTGSMVQGRSRSSATLLSNGQVLLAGGDLYDTLEGCSTSAELYDPPTGTWTVTSNLNVGRSFFTATTLPNGYVLVAGGCRGLRDAELYDADVGSFPTSQPTTLTGTRILPNGSFQFSFTNTPAARFSVLATTIPTLPLNYWMVLSGVTETVPGQFQFTDAQATNYAGRYYRVRSP